MTGGSVMMSTTSDVVAIFGRVSSAGVKVAPASGAGGWTVATTGTGVYVVTFKQSYPEFMGASADVEGNADVSVSFAWSLAAKTLTVNTFNQAGGAVNGAFSFMAFFSENKAP